jgi:RNA polymerase sigma factor (sigma-70 family)
LRKSHHQAAIARQVRTLFEVGAIGHLTDRELLERFATRDGEAAEVAFEVLVERHGPMVLRACRSNLRDPDEAQDAFQSTFLLLARRAGSLWVRDSLAPWLHSVACRVAHGRRVAEGRRRALERRFALRLARSPEPSPRDDLGPALHEEIDRLPERLKAPVVLCHLEGLTHEMAAEHLNCPVGTVRSRLSRGRERLRRALARRGFAAPSSDPGSSQIPAVPASLAALTIHAARLVSERSATGLLVRFSFFLAEGVLKPMMYHPLRSTVVVLLATGAIAVGLGATPGQKPKLAEKPAQVEAAVRDQSAIEKRFEALDQRVRNLEAELKELKADTRPTQRHSQVDQNTLNKIRPRFDRVLVEQVFVTPGQAVKKGEALLIIRSAELAEAKTDLRKKYLDWDRDHFRFLLTEELVKKQGVSKKELFLYRNTENRSRLDYLAARERLASCGMTSEQINTLVADLADKLDAQDLNDEQRVRELSTMTVVSPVDGVVVERNVVPGNFYDQTDVLLTITPPKP